MMRKLPIIIVGIYLMSAIQTAQGQKGDWFNEHDNYMLSGSGTRDNPYLISSVADIVYLAEQANTWTSSGFKGRHFLLTNNIDLGLHYWIPIGSERERPFQGIFNGNGKTIYNLNIGNIETGNVFESSGLFGYLGNGAKVTNLTIEDGKIVGGGRENISHTGSLAGLLTCHVFDNAEDSIIIRNCHNKGVEVIGGKAEYSITGGLVGEGYALCGNEGASVILLEDCTNSGYVYGEKASFTFTGGIIGKAHGDGKSNHFNPSTGACIIRSCYNTGAITGGTVEESDAIASTGGLTGYVMSSGYCGGNMEGAGIFSMKYCMNTGKITGGIARTAKSFTYTGGLLGYVEGYGYGNRGAQNSKNNYGSGTFTLTCSANSGNVEGGNVLDATASTGGLLGYASISAFTSKGIESSKGSGKLDVKDCYNHSQVSAKSGFLGGLTGSIATFSSGDGDNQVSAIIHNSYVSGSIICHDTLNIAAIGGIAGRIQKSNEAVSSPQIADCLVALKYLKGNISRTFRIAGQIYGVEPPYNRILTRNYAHISEGEWLNSVLVQNGREWDSSMLSLPMSNWDFKNKVWLLEEDMMSMPLLNHLNYQTRIDIPR